MCRMIDYNGVQVAEIKKDYLDIILNAVKREPHAKVLIVYGSVLKDTCSDDSDIAYSIIGDLSLLEGYQMADRVKDECLKYDLGQNIRSHYFSEEDFSLSDVISTGIEIGRGVVIWER